MRFAVNEFGQVDTNLIHGGEMISSVGWVPEVLLANVSVCGAEVWPTVTLPKFTLAGVKEGGVEGVIVTPLPDKPPLTEPLVVVMVSRPLYGCTAVGENTTVNWQLALATSVPVQFELNVNGAVAEAPVRAIGPGPGLVSVITCGADDVPTATLPKFTLLGVSDGGS